MKNLYPDYDVLSKRASPSWNEQTRKVVDERLAIEPGQHGFFDESAWRTLCALCARIIPQPADRQRPVPVAAMIDQKLRSGKSEGYRDARLPPMREAWRCGLAALDAEALSGSAGHFHELAAEAQDTLLRRVQTGDAFDPAWAGMPPALFFTERALHDIVSAYYSHPTAWSEIGFGGPTGPRGYVRMDYDRRDPWEASEARPGREDQARRENARVG